MDLISMWPLLSLAALTVVSLLGIRWWQRRAYGGRDPRMSARPSSVRRGSRRRRDMPAHDEQLDTLAAWEPAATRVLKSGERDAYQVLRRALPEYIILAQVPVTRFVKVPTRNSYAEWLRRVGSLCADLVVCDASSQVVAVVEIRAGHRGIKDSALRRQQRMDRVLQAARIPVHVWLEGALPGPAVAREAVLGAALDASPAASDGSAQADTRRDVEAGAVVASMQTGVDVAEHSPLDFDVQAWVNSEHDGDMHDAHLAARNLPDSEPKEPPPSTWFDDLDTDPSTALLPDDQSPVVRSEAPIIDDRPQRPRMVTEASQVRRA